MSWSQNMVSKYILYREAANDLENIVSYISVELSNPEAAMGVLEKIEQRFQDLMNFPYLYPLIESNKLIVEGVRKSVIDNYVIVYIMNETENQIEVIRVILYREDYL